MSKNTKIEWCYHTFNPWIGCTKVSPGCANCYASVETFPRVQRAKGVELWGKGKARHRTSAAYWRQPLAWNHQWAEQNTTLQTTPRPRVFCASMADWLDDEVCSEWLADLLKLIHDTPNLDWLLLTKRPQNWLPRINEVCRLWACDGGFRETEVARIYHDWLCPWRSGKAPDNIWLGTSVEDQQRADERVPELLNIPARVRFLSVEPMLGPINLRTIASRPNPPYGFTSTNVLDPANGLHWVILGGESGSNARPCNVRWIRTIVQECGCSRVKVFVKQLGAHIVDRNDAGFEGDEGEWPMDTATKDIDSGYQGAPVRVILRNKKGGEMAEWPADLRVREFPNVTMPVMFPELEKV